MIKIKNSWFFVWNGLQDELVLHDKTKEEAYKIADSLGWTPRVWYKPSTWMNYVRYYGRG